MFCAPGESRQGGCRFSAAVESRQGGMQVSTPQMGVLILPFLGGENLHPPCCFRRLGNVVFPEEHNVSPGG